jgi:hypothetical protein
VNYIVTAGQVRDYLELNSPGTSSRYSDETIGSNLRAAQSFLEAECRRYFYDHPGVTWAKTTLLQAQVDLPGFRSFTSVTWGGSTLSVCVPGDGNDNCSAWGLWEDTPGAPDTGRLVVALQFRPWRVDNDRPWYYADSLWWDKALDSPFYPGNYGGGYAYTSMPNDLVIVGDGGYAPGNEPEALKQAVKVLAAWYTMRPASIMGNMAKTPTGSIAYSELPPEVQIFIAGWKVGQQVASVG